MTIFSLFRRIAKDEPVKTHLRKTKNIVYGARAMNQQLPLHLRRNTDDFDIYASKPRNAARKMEKHLDKHYGGDYYFVRPAIHPGTFKVIDKGMDNKPNTKDDYPIADYTKPNRKIRFMEKDRIRYARLSERRKDIKTSLRDKESAYRHQKDKADLQGIKYKQQMRRLIK